MEFPGLDRLRPHLKKYLSILLGAVTAIALVFGVLFHLNPPILKASNLINAKHEIASNAPIILGFNQLMSRTSVENGFTMVPAVSGRVSWFLNTLTFMPHERFTIGQTYTVALTGKVQNILGKPLGEDMVFTFLVVDPPKVSLAVPNGETKTDTKITVMFDRPMTELTTYDVVESRDFPLQLSPELPGRFKWIGTSAFQFLAKDRLAYSTEYSATIPAGIHSLDGGEMEETYTFTFRTERIQRIGSLPEKISARPQAKKIARPKGATSSTPFEMRFNQPVNLDSVKEHVKIKGADGEMPLSMKYQKRKEVTYEKEKKIEKEVEDKSVVEVLPILNDWGYDNQFTVSITKGIAGLEGNLFSEEEIEAHKFRTGTFLTGKIPGDSPTDNSDKFANPSGGIELYFDQEVDLGSVRDNFTITPSIELAAKFGKKCDPKWEPKESPDEKCDEIVDETVVILTPKEKLKNVHDYSARLAKAMKAKNGIAYLKKDVEWSFRTADVFKIAGSTPERNATGSYKQICLFTNNYAETKDIEKQIVFEPESRGKVTVSAYDVHPNFTSGDYQYDDEYNRNQNQKPCRAKPDDNHRFAMEISALLMPNTKHKLKIKAAAVDIFGQMLGSDYQLDFTTEPLKDVDTNLELVNKKDTYAIATLDQHAAPVFATRNLANFDLEICKLSASQFIAIDSENANEERRKGKRWDQLGWEGFNPSSENCLEYFSINKKVKTVYWEKQYTEINLKEELSRAQASAEWVSLGRAPDPGYYFLRASSPKVYRFDYGPEKNKIPIRPRQILGLTNLHLLAKGAKENALFWTTDITTGQPIANVAIRLFSNAGTPLDGVSTTNASGIAKRELHNLPFHYAVAKKGNEETAVHMYMDSGIGPWDFNISSSQLQNYTQGYIYTDRPLYQPTHEVFFKGILRDDADAVLSLPKAKEIDVEIYDSRSIQVYKKKLPVSAQGTFTDVLKLDAAASLGRYSIGTCLRWGEDKSYCTDGSFYQDFFVEEYRKPEYKLEVSFPQESYRDHEEMRGLVDAEYFFGAPVTDGKLTWSLKSQNYYFDEYKEEWFSFTDNETFRKCYFGCPYDDQYLANGDGKLDAKGQFLITHKIDLSTKDQQGKIKPPDTSKIYTLEATVQDKNNQTVAGRKEAIVHRGAFYVGVKNEQYIVGVKEDMPIKVIAVDPKGRPLPGKSIDLDLFKQEWKYVKKKQIDGGFYWENELDSKLVKSTSVETGDDGKARYEFRMKEGGEYLVRATSKDELGNVISSTVDFYVTSDRAVHWKQENNNRMELKLDKITYEVGDTAKVLIKSPYTNVKALVTHERGDVFASKVIDVTSNTQTIEVPITEKMIPNFYVSVAEVKGGNKDDLPDFKMGFANIIVDAKKKELMISVKPDKERYTPRERVSLDITTTDRNGKPVSAELSIAAVDSSLLALKGNPKRDLVNVFYNRRGLGVSTVSNMTIFLDRVDISDKKGAKGGGGKGADEAPKVRGKFEDTAFWRSTVTTDANGKLSTSFALPDNLTTWNIEVIGASPKSLFGSTNVTVTSQKPVIVRPVLPRFVLFQDSLNLGAIVHNFTDQDGKFAVSIETKNLDVTSGSSQKVFIPAGGSTKVLFETKVPKVKLGTEAEVTLSATGEGGQDAIVQSFPIFSYSTPETVALSSFTDDLSFTEKVLLPSSIDPDLGELKITTGATLATFLSDSLNYLMQFPYNCTEQIVSQLVPMIAIKNATSLPNLQDKLKLAPVKDENGKVVPFDTLVSTNLQKLYQYQRPDGGWGYWQESRESYPSVTAYALFGLEQIKKAGYSVDQNVISRAVSYLRNYMLSNKDLKDFTGKLREKTPHWANKRAYMLFVMSETGRGDIGLANSLYGDRKLLGNGGLAYLAMSLDSADKRAELIRELENQARIETRGTYIRNDIGSSFDMMTHTKVTSLTLQLLNRHKPDHPLIPKLVKWLIGSRHEGRWDTTQDTSTALIVLTEYLEKNKETEAAYEATVTIGKKVESRYSVNAQNILDTKELSRQISDFELGGDGTKVIFAKDGTGRLYYDMVLRYFLPIEEIKPRGEGFNIERSYYKVDDTKLEHPIKEASPGETLRGHLTIVVPEERNLVAVENFLPAGFELVNFEFETAQTSLLDKPSDSDAEMPKPPITDFRVFEVGDYSHFDYGIGYSGYYYGNSQWNHKELRPDRLFLFADRLPKGVYEYDYFVQVTSEGRFHHPPAIISEMYFPENFGRTSGGWFGVK